MMLLGTHASAQLRNQAEAINTARQFLAAKGIKAVKPVVVELPVAPAVQGSPHRIPSVSGGYHIVIDEQARGFVIVSADERMHTVLGWSDKGSFHSDNLPPGLVSLLEEYSREYAYLQEHGTQRISRAPSITVKPLIQTTWGQSWPYNDQCPIDEHEEYADQNEKCVTGCVATAMAQVMRYYNYPTQGKGSHSYTPPSFSTEQRMDFSSCQFDWANMPNSLSRESSSTEINAVAQLMHACGVAVEMEYGAGVSSAYGSYSSYALPAFFGYSPAVRRLFRNYYTSEDWESLILTELQARRPIIYSGQGTEGHEFILDGCSSDGYHINWGWYGWYDGYFMLNAMTPVEDADYSYDQEMTINIQIGDGPREHTHYVSVFDLFEIPKDGLEVGSYWSGYLYGLTCMCSEANGWDTTCQTHYGIGLFDMNWNFVKALGNGGETNLKLNYMYNGGRNYNFNFDAETFTDGVTYYIAPYVQGMNDNVITRIRTKGGKSDYYKLEVHNGRIYQSVRPITPIAGGTGTGTKDNPYNCIAAINLANTLGMYEISEPVYIKGYFVGGRNDMPVINTTGNGEDREYTIEFKWCAALGNTDWETGLDADLDIGDEVVICCTLYYDWDKIVLAPPSNAYYVSINGETEPAKGKKCNPYTVTEVLPKIKALGTGSQDYFYASVKGYITNIKEVSTKFGNATFTINDTKDGSGSSLYIYRIKGLDGQSITDANLIKEGDLVMVYGKMVNFKGNTPEISNDGYLLSIETPTDALPGDANGDGVVDVADVVAIVNYILNKPADNFNEQAADVNGDNVIDVADVVAVVNIILKSGQ